MEYYSASIGEPEARARGTVLLFGFMGSTPRIRAKYAQVWGDLGFNVVATGLSPLDGIIGMMVSERYFGSRIHEMLDKLVETSKTPQSDSSIIVHIMSEGGVRLWAVAMQLMGKDSKYSFIRRNIRGVVFDSCPYRPQWRTSIRAFAPEGTKAPIRLTFAFSIVVAFSVLSYFLSWIPGLLRFVPWLHNPTWVKYRETMWNGFLGSVPQLYLYGGKDRTCLPDYITEYSTKQREKQGGDGRKVRAVCWADSGHVEHLRRHQDEYTKELSEFSSYALNTSVM